MKVEELRGALQAKNDRIVSQPVGKANLSKVENQSSINNSFEWKKPQSSYNPDYRNDRSSHIDSDRKELVYDDRFTNASNQYRIDIKPDEHRSYEIARSQPPRTQSAIGDGLAQNSPKNDAHHRNYSSLVNYNSKEDSENTFRLKAEKV